MSERYINGNKARRSQFNKYMTKSKRAKPKKTPSKEDEPNTTSSIKATNSIIEGAGITTLTEPPDVSVIRRSKRLQLAKNDAVIERGKSTTARLEGGKGTKRKREDNAVSNNKRPQKRQKLQSNKSVVPIELLEITRYNSKGRKIKNETIRLTRKLEHNAAPHNTEGEVDAATTTRANRVPNSSTKERLLNKEPVASCSTTGKKAKMDNMRTNRRSIRRRLGKSRRALPKSTAMKRSFRGKEENREKKLSSECSASEDTSVKRDGGREDPSFSKVRVMGDTSDKMLINSGSSHDSSSKSEIEDISENRDNQPHSDYSSTIVKRTIKTCMNKGHGLKSGVESQSTATKSGTKGTVKVSSNEMTQDNLIQIEQSDSQSSHTTKLERLQDEIEEFMPQLISIMKGEKQTPRADQWSSGLKARSQMHYKVHVGGFESGGIEVDDILNIVQSKIMKMQVPESVQRGGVSHFILDVLWPELAVLLLAARNHVSEKEAEQLFTADQELEDEWNKTLKQSPDRSKWNKSTSIIILD